MQGQERGHVLHLQWETIQFSFKRNFYNFLNETDFKLCEIKPYRYIKKPMHVVLQINIFRLISQNLINFKR